MGAGSSESEYLLPEHEILEYSKISSFTHDEIDNIYRYYVHFSQSRNDDGVIDFPEFCQAMALPDTLVTKRIFSIFDTNGDKVINFREFLTGLSYFLYETTEQQIILSFRLFDPECKGYCTSKDLKEIIKCYLITMPNLLIGNKQNDIKEKIVDQIATQMVNDTMKNIEFEHGQTEQITYREYRKIYFKDNIASKWLLMDMEKVKNGVSILTRRLLF